MIRTFLIGFSLFTLLLLSGCGASSPTLATIGDEQFTLRDFENAYMKNNGVWDSCARSSLEERQKFLDLIVKFKLKVKEARAIGLEKDSAVISEMETYNVSVAQSYMLEKELVETGIQQLYQRKKEEVRVSHILFRLLPSADTAAIYERAKKVITEIPTTPFESLAVKYSEDPGVKTNHGDLGFFSGGRMVPEFEDACFSLKPGEYTKTPIRSQYGYHVIKVAARQPNPGSVRISHILLRFNETSSDTASVRDTAWMLYRKLKNGTAFKDGVKKYSQDPGSVEKDGDIGFYERERIPPNIADIFYKLQVDSISEPTRFNYGYHIFKLMEKKPVPPLAEIQQDLKAQYQQVRYQYEYSKYVQGLKARYRVVVDSAAVSKLIASIDTTQYAGAEKWKDTLTAETIGATLIQRIDRPFRTKDFIEKVMNNTEYSKNILNRANTWMLINKLTDDAALEAHARRATERHPVLGRLLQEYTEGILLYRIEQDEVWKKVVVNDSLLREYYAVHKENYRWPERVNFAEIYTLADSMANAAYWKVQYGEDFRDVAKECTNRTANQEKGGEWGFQLYTVNELARKASTMAIDSVTAPFRYEAGWSILKTLAFDSARVKNFEEATPEVAGAYQEAASKQREQDWVELLKKKYPVTVKKELLPEAFKGKRVETQ